MSTMPTYTCEKCARVFKQKSGFDAHMDKKKDCSTTTAIAAIVHTVVAETAAKLVRSTTSAKLDITKETLPAFYEDFHNLLWNKAGLNPEKALDHMTFFFAYRLIEQQADALALPQDCRWSYIASLKNEHELFEAIKRGVTWFRHPERITRPFFKPHEIQKAEIVCEIIQEINRIPLTILQETDTLGDIFEHMLGRGMSTMADEGQYFTARAICRLAFKKCYEIKKTLRRSDGSLCVFADWFAGTGGFPAEFIKGVNAHVPDVNWKEDSKSIYCQDMNVSSVTTTLLNLLILTGVPFSGTTIRSANSFADPIIQGPGAPYAGLAVDYCFMNPPYGGDKTKGKEYKFAYSKTTKDEAGVKTKRFFVNSDIQSIGIEDDDKVSAGVQLAMATLSSDGGVCAIVLPQGFFFGASKKCVELRKKIAEDYKIHYVVDIASGAFANTGTKTSMLIFQKGVGPTEKMSFIGLDEKSLVEATLEELRAKHYSLNFKQYLPQTAVEVEGFEMLKLGDIAKKLSTRGKHSAKDTIDKGKYSLFSSSVNEIYKLNTFDYPETCCIVNSTNASGNAVVNLGREFSVTSDTFVFKCDNDLTTKYMQLYLSHNIQLVKDQFQGANHKHPTWDRLASITIPLPSLERQAEIVEAIDGWVTLAQQEEVALKILEKQMMFQVKEMGRGQARVKLGTVCDIKCGKPMPKTDIVEGDVPVIGGGISPMGFHNVSTHEAYTPMISQRGENSGYVSRYSSKTWITSNAVIPALKNNLMLVNNDVLYYVLKCNEEAFYNIVVKTAQPMLTVGNLLLVELQLPPLTEQLPLQPDFDEIRHKHEKIAEYKAKAQAAIQRLIPGAETKVDETAKVADTIALI